MQGQSTVARPDTAETDLGVVWTPPSRSHRALAEIRRIRAVGATAVRTTALPPDTVLVYADTAGMKLYVDVPLSTPSGSSLQNALFPSPPGLGEIRRKAQAHRSVQFVGLGGPVETVSSSTCKAIARWTRDIHQGSTGLRTYYVTPLSPAADQCAQSVDRVLLDLRGDRAPIEKWTRWRSSESAVGIGVLGTWTDPSRETGLRVPHSPERQARYLETALASLLDSTRTPPPAVFIERWQDRPSDLLPSRRYGLHDTTGAARPAAAVVRGFYSGTQRVFAFPSGSEPDRQNHILLLVGWALLALLGAIYTQSLFVRRTIGRYFLAHGFYRDALREGRDLQPGLNGLLLGTVVLSLGATTVLAARQAAAHPVIQHVLEALPHPIATAISAGVEHPMLAGLAVGGTALVMVTVWLTALVAAARRWTRFTLSQGLVVVVWPAWPALTALPVALAAGPHSPLTPSVLAFSLGLGSLFAVAYYSYRVVGDYRAVTNLPWIVVAPLAALSPLVLLGLAGIVLHVQYPLQYDFLWQLATSSL